MQKFRVLTLAAQVGLPVDRALADLLGVARSRARQLFLQRQALCDGKPCKPADRVLRAGQVLQGKLPELIEPETAFTILWEDVCVLAVNKPAGLQTHAGSDTSRPDLVSQIRASKGDGWVLLHRLDKDTSGVILLARSGDSNRSLAQQFEARQVLKGYHCWVQGRPPRTAWRCKQALLETRSKVLVDATRGKPSLTEFTQIRRQGACTLLEARPRTGRKHQIRVHLQACSLPILGDTLYGGADAPRMLLHAAWLEFLHPGYGEKLRVEAPAPLDFQAI